MATTTAATLALRRLVQSSRIRVSTTTKATRHVSHLVASASASFSTNPITNKKEVNPGDFVHGVTAADLENEPRLQEYFAANFPVEFGTGEDDNDLYVDLDAIDVHTVNNVKKGQAGNASNAGNDVTSKEDDGAQTEDDEIDVLAYQCDLSLNIRPLIAYKRTEEGSRQCRELRETTNLMPGIMYGSDPTQGIKSIDQSSKLLVKTPWRFIQRELDRFTYHNFESRVYDLTLFEDEDDTEGTVHRVMPRDVQFHPVQNTIYCCNYLRYYPGKLINIPIVYINEEESPAIKRGGFLAPFNRHVSCIVEDGVKIPEAIELDFNGARLKEVIRKNRLVFPDGVSPSHKVKDDFLLGTVFGRRSDDAGSDDAEKATA